MSETWSMQRPKDNRYSLQKPYATVRNFLESDVIEHHATDKIRSARWRQVLARLWSSAYCLDFGGQSTTRKVQANR